MLPDYKNKPSLHIGILSQKKILFELSGEYCVHGLSKTLNGLFTASIKENKINLENGSDILSAESEIIFEPKNFDFDSFLVQDVIIGIKFHWQRKEEERFKGTLKLIKDGDDLTLINILPIEDYLVSVNSSEMSATSSIELLKAHAIVTRSWLLAQKEKSKEIKNYNTNSSLTDDEIIKWYDREEHKLYDVCADDHCQRYQGISKISTEAVKQAVSQTSGVVLVSEDKICDARFSKSCGGISESFENVWEPVKHAYLSPVIDSKYKDTMFDINFSEEDNAVKWIKGNPAAFCNSSDRKILSQILLDYDQETADYFRWVVSYSQKELSQLIMDKSGIDFGNILDLIPVERGASARLIKLKIVGSKKVLTVGKELEIRRMLSPTHLYSAAIVIEKFDVVDNIPLRFKIFGAGWGHGVGLCQIGAAVMAEKGYKYDEILSHYFKNTKLIKLY